MRYTFLVYFIYPSSISIYSFVMLYFYNLEKVEKKEEEDLSTNSNVYILPKKEYESPIKTRQNFDFEANRNEKFVIPVNKIKKTVRGKHSTTSNATTISTTNITTTCVSVAKEILSIESSSKSVTTDTPLHVHIIM